MTKEADKVGVDIEKMRAPLTLQVIEEAKEAASLAVTLLLSPVGTNGRSGDKAFYANALMTFRTQFTNTVSGQPLDTAGVSVTDKVNLYINPHFFLSLSVNKQIELYIHEIEHVMNLHMLRGKELMSHSEGMNARSVHQLYNIATDANINVPLTDLTETLGVTIERLNDQLKKLGSKQKLSASDPSEVHFWKLRQVQEEMGDKLPKGFGQGSGGELDDHGTWGESVENEEMMKEVVKDSMNKAAQATGIGNCPANIVKALENLNKSKVDWKREIHKAGVSALKFERERTRTRRNRRTGIIFPGGRKIPKVKIALIGDESGSMSDEQVTQVYAEVLKLTDMGIEVYYIPMDVDAGEVVKMKKNTKLDRTKSGGTVYSGGIKKAEEMGVNLIVVAGDFDCADKPVKPNCPVLWVGINTKSPPPADFGKVIYVETDK